MHICRTRFKQDIITEFVPSARKNSSRAVIFCPGVPGSPDEDEFLTYYAKKGYWTFYPRYRGTWESDGLFLKEPPLKDIIDVIDCLYEPFTDYWDEETYQFKPTHITVVGNSFGGPAAILSTLDKRVNKAVCLSPVVDWIAEHKYDPLENLYDILHEAYGAAYRVNKNHYDQLLTGEFYNPAAVTDKINGEKILILHAQDDDIVPITSVKKFAKTTNSQFIELKHGGHLSSDIILLNRYYSIVKKFLHLDNFHNRNY